MSESQGTESSAVAQKSGNSSQEFSEELLKIYYARLCPYDSLFNWLSYGNNPTDIGNKAIDREYFPHREWSFTMANDVYIRYQSFKSQQELIATIQKMQPHKIDIGAVFTKAPKDSKTIKQEFFKPVERELVFDIDMTDYDDIRTCCTGANICHRCWPYMTMAVKVIDLALREDFGFKNILWVYSGRRGVHCWVCDPAARALTNEARGAVVEFLSVHTGSSENSDKRIKQSFSNPHPSLRRAYSLLEPYFASFIADGSGQGLLADKKRYMPVLNSLPNDSIRRDLYEEWDRDDTLSGRDRWNQIVLVTSKSGDESSAHQQLKKRKISFADLESWRYELVFTHCYARLDANVSKTQNHLLKSPFCVHPKTGRVCVPIDPQNADEFDPFVVPTVRTLCDEIDVYDSTHKTESVHDGASAAAAADVETTSDLDKTSLKQAVEVFNKTFWKPMWKSITLDFRDRLDQISAMNVDF